MLICVFVGRIRNISLFVPLFFTLVSVHVRLTSETELVSISDRLHTHSSPLFSYHAHSLLQVWRRHLRENICTYKRYCSEGFVLFSFLL